MFFISTGNILSQEHITFFSLWWQLYWYLLEFHHAGHQSSCCWNFLFISIKWRISLCFWSLCNPECELQHHNGIHRCVFPIVTATEENISEKRFSWKDSSCSACIQQARPHSCIEDETCTNPTLSYHSSFLMVTFSFAPSKIVFSCSDRRGCTTWQSSVWSDCQWTVKHISELCWQKAGLTVSVVLKVTQVFPVCCGYLGL